MESRVKFFKCHVGFQNHQGQEDLYEHMKKKSCACNYDCYMIDYRPIWCTVGAASQCYWDELMLLKWQLMLLKCQLTAIKCDPILLKSKINTQKIRKHWNRKLLTLSKHFVGFKNPFFYYLRWSDILIALAHTLIALLILIALRSCTGWCIPDFDLALISPIS